MNSYYNLSGKLLGRLAVALFVVGQLGACSSVATLLSTDGPASYGPLDYFDWLRNASAPLLDAEQARLEILNDPDSKSIASIQLSMLLGSRGDSASLQQAVALIAGPPMSCTLLPRCQQYEKFSLLWGDYLARQQRLGTAIASDTARAEEISALGAEIATLRQQIDDLTRIERQIIEREQPPEPQ